MDPFLIAFLVVAFLVIVFAIVWSRRRAQAWSNAVREAAKTFGLKFHHPEGAITSAYDTAVGDYEGLAIDIGTRDVAQSYHAKAVRHMRITVNGDIDRDLKIGALGEIAAGDEPPGTIDYGDTSDEEEPVPTGDSELDAVVEIVGARDELLEALTDTELRAQLARFVRADGMVEHGKLILMSRSMPTSEDEIVAHVARMIEIAHAIEELQPS